MPVPPRNLRRKMPKKRLTVLQAKYLEVADLFLWGRQIDFTAWFTGLWSPRNKRTETILPQLERMNVIHSKWYSGQKVYTTSKRESETHIPHGLVCTKALLRFKFSGGGEFIPEGFFREKRFKAIPEWAVKYEKNMILFEYSTADNFRRKRMMKDKIKSYEQELDKFAQTFQVKPYVLFLLGAPRHRVENFGYVFGDENFFFVDQHTFFSVPVTEQLTREIYIWGRDGEVIPLKRNG